MGAEAPGEQPVPAQIQQEEVPPPPEKPPEKPPEVPSLIPSGVSYLTGLTFQPAPSLGTLAPYGYGAAENTLIRGLVRHPLGPIGVFPSLEYDGMYRTNVFSSYNHKESDFVNTINPGIGFELPVAGQHKLSVGYLGNAFIYSRYGDLSHFDQNVNVDGALNFPRLSLRVGSAFRAATEEPYATVVSTISIGRQRFYYRTTPYLEASYKVADLWRLEANYQFDYLAFGKTIDHGNNYQYNTLSTTLFYKFWPKTSALVQYMAAIRTFPYNSPNDNVVHTPMVGLQWDPTAKLSGTIKFGYTIANYYNAPALPGYTSTTNSWALSIQTNYKITTYTNVSLVAQRSIQQDTDYANSTYINTGVFSTLTHNWHYFDITSYMTFSYFNSSYQADSFNSYTGAWEKRNDNYISFGSGLSRPVTRWLQVRLDYLYTDRGSNFNYYANMEHKVLFGLRSTF
jgi:hypothetical protein